MQLQQPTISRDAYGGAVKSFTTAQTVWAAIEPLSGREFIAISQTQNEARVRIVIRYHSSIDTDWRVVKGSKTYTIHEIQDHDDRHTHMTLMCSEGVQTE